jgi:hypothetical protein
VQQQIQAGSQRAAEVASRPFEAYNGQRVAGLTPQQQAARTMATAQAGAWQPGLQQAQQATGQSLFAPREITAQRVAAPTMGPAAMTPTVGRATTMTAEAHAIDANDIMRLTNPWMSQVEDATLRSLRRATDQSQASLGQRFGAGSSFGGSRHAIASAELEARAMEEAAAQSAQLRAQGFNTALGAAAQDAGRRQEASLFNAGAFNQAGEAAAGRAQAAGLFNAEAANQMAIEGSRQQLAASTTSADLDLQGQRANQAAQEARGQRALQAAEMYRGLAGDTARFGAADLGILNELGAEERGLNQAGLDAAYEEFMRAQRYPIEMLAAYQSGSDPAALSLFVGNRTTGTTYDPARNLQAAGSLIQGIGSLFSSDRRLKADIELLGREPGGLAWYAYRYVWDAPGVRRIGVMGQEAPAHAVHEQHGYLAVDYGAL